MRIKLLIMKRQVRVIGGTSFLPLTVDGGEWVWIDATEAAPAFWAFRGDYELSLEEMYPGFIRVGFHDKRHPAFGQVRLVPIGAVDTLELATDHVAAPEWPGAVPAQPEPLPSSLSIQEQIANEGPASPKKRYRR